MKSLNQFKAELMCNPEFAKAYQEIQPDIDEIRANIGHKPIQIILPNADMTQGNSNT